VRELQVIEAELGEPPVRLTQAQDGRRRYVVRVVRSAASAAVLPVTPSLR
jgi:hypothetical protein